MEASQDTSFGDKIRLEGTIKDTSPNELYFAVLRHTDTHKIVVDTLALQGTWQADEKNKLIFKVKKEVGPQDILTFNNTWIIDNNNRLIYEYEKADLVFKKKETYRLSFKGYWNITKDNRLYYELDNITFSGFEFKLGTSVLEKNQIKAKVKIGTKEKEIIINGEWKISLTFGLTLEVGYGDNEVKSLVLGGEINLTAKDTLHVKLGKSLDIKLTQEMLDSKTDFSITYHQGEGETKAEVGFGVGL